MLSKLNQPQSDTYRLAKAYLELKTHKKSLYSPHTLFSKDDSFDFQNSHKILLFLFQNFVLNRFLEPVKSVSSNFLLILRASYHLQFFFLCNHFST